MKFKTLALKRLKTRREEYTNIQNRKLNIKARKICKLIHTSKREKEKMYDSIQNMFYLYFEYVETNKVKFQRKYASVSNKKY